MKWSIKQIQELNGLSLKFSEQVTVKSILIERDSEIIDVSDVSIDGELLYDNHSIIANFNMHVELVLPSSRTLNPTPVVLNILVNERYVEEGYMSQYAEHLKDEVINPLSETYIDLTESIVDNILLNLPIQVLSDTEQNDDEAIVGDGWILYTEDTYNKQKQKEKETFENPQFASLKTLLKDID